MSNKVIHFTDSEEYLNLSHMPRNGILKSDIPCSGMKLSNFFEKLQSLFIKLCFGQVLVSDICLASVEPYDHSITLNSMSSCTFRILDSSKLCIPSNSQDYKKILLYAYDSNDAMILPKPHLHIQDCTISDEGHSMISVSNLGNIGVRVSRLDILYIQR